MDIAILNEFSDNLDLYFTHQGAYADITKNREKYAQKRGYSFIEITGTDDSVHWNWQNWLAIKEMITLIESGLPDIDWIWYADAKILVTNYDIELDSFINTHAPSGQEIIIPRIIPKLGNKGSHKWYKDLRGEIIPTIYSGNTHTIILPCFMAVKNSSNALNFLKTIYDDIRFTQNNFSKEYHIEKYKELYIKNADIIPSTAFTIYHEGYPEYRDLLSLPLSKDIISGISEDNTESFQKRNIALFKNKGRKFEEGDHFAGVMCTQTPPIVKIKQIIDSRV